MMTDRTARRVVLCVLVGTAALTQGACGDFLSITNPNIVDASAIDPVADAEMLAMSAQQDLAETLPDFIRLGSILTGSTWTANINAPENLVAIRRVDPTVVVGGLFSSISTVRAAASRVLEALAGTEGEAASLPIARASLVAGYSFVLLGEYFCRGTVAGGPELDATMMMDSAVAYLDRAADVGRANGTPEAMDLANAAAVVTARAHMQAGRTDEALRVAAAVDDAFGFFLPYADDLASRGRVSNGIATRTLSQTTIIVAPPYRDDPRIPVLAPGEHGLVPMDGETEVWAQAKYPSYDSPIRLASGLEARYIEAEATGTQAMLDFLAARRAAAELPPYDGATDAASVLAEFLDQKHRDLYLEGQRMGDFRRHPEAVRNVPVPGTTYRKDGYETVGETSCFPLPLAEVTNNPNL